MRILDDFIALLSCDSTIVYSLLRVNIRLYGVLKHLLICIFFPTQLLKIFAYRFLLMLTILFHIRRQFYQSLWFSDLLNFSFGQFHSTIPLQISRVTVINFNSSKDCQLKYLIHCEWSSHTYLYNISWHQ